ncbi:MAG: PIN domain-containing protein [Fibrobacteraceae bacterium]|nr:PIN domain-containing protein [Fibrobacteraceae bacterium]
MNRFIENSRILFLDTGPLIRLLQMHPDFYPVVSGVLDLVYDKNMQVLVSAVTLYEISKKAFDAGNSVLARQYREFFENSHNVKLVDVNGEVAVKAAELAAAHHLGIEESLRLSLAYIHGADCILTESEAFKDYTDIPVVTLEEVF